MRFAIKKDVLLGTGISGLVYLHVEGKGRCVVKRYNKMEPHEIRSEYKKRILVEYNILRELDHPNFIKALRYEISFTKTHITVYLEAGYRDLRYLMRPFKFGLPLDESLCLWKQICSGVRYLHSKGYCHRDLKLENVVLSETRNTVKIIDLATAATTKSPSFGLVGSVHYIAPEQVTALCYQGESVDMWSLGVIIYFLLTKKYPWSLAQMSDPVYLEYLGMSERERRELLKKGVECEEVVSLLLDFFLIDPTDRMDIEVLFLDPWFQRIRCCVDDKDCGIVHKIRGTKG